MVGKRKRLERLKEEYLQLIEAQKGRVVGIGVTAFNRIGPGFFYPKYEIVCYKDGSDIKALKKIVKVKSIQRDLIEDGDIRRNNSLAILKHKGVQRYLKKLYKAKIFLYRTTERVDKLCESLGFEVFANEYGIRDEFEDKKKFFKRGRKMGLPMIPGEQLKVDDLSSERYGEIKDRIGEKLVFQLVDFFRGGGQGTFFIKNDDDLEVFFKLVDRLRDEKPTKVWNDVNVTRLIEGLSPSITGCATRHGVLTTPVQTQILDIPELLESERSGVYLGHDWSFRHYSEKVQKQADKIAKSLGEHMYKQGYRGIFGVDLIIDSKDGTVYPIECNPRYTGAFPVYTMLQVDYKEIPLDVFQLMEFFDIDYEMDFDLVDQSWKQPKEGAHFGLHSPYEDKWSRAAGDMPAGVYRLSKGKLEWVREGVTYQDLKEKEEFVVTDGCPRKGQLVKPKLRVGKMIFKQGVLERTDRLKSMALEAYRKVLKKFDFKAVPSEEQKLLDERYGYKR